MQVIGGLGNGGAEKLVVELCNELSLKDEVSLLSFRKIEKWMAFPKILNDNVDLITANKKPGFSFNWYIKLLKIVRIKKPDVINLHLDSALIYFLPFIFILKTFFFRNTDFFYTIHNKLVLSSKIESDLTNYSNSQLFDLISKFRVIPIRFICISKSILNDFESRYKKMQFSLIENGCDKMVETKNSVNINREINQFRINEESVVFLSIGRINLQKNYEMALRVMDACSSKNLILLIIGNESTKGRPLFNYLKSIKPKNVFFLETVDNVSDYIVNSDAILFTSHYEGMPISAIEAMSMGKPIICTPAGGLVDMIEPKVNGFISKDFSDLSLIEEVNNFINLGDKDLELIKNKNLEAFETRYSLQICASNYRKIYVKSI